MIKCLIYCTKDKNNQLYRYYGNKYGVLKDKQHTMPQPDFFMNGKIVAQLRDLRSVCGPQTYGKSRRR